MLRSLLKRERLWSSRRWLASAAVAAMLLLTRGSPAADPPSTEEPALRAYRTACGLLDRGLNELAVEEFQRFLATYPEHEKAALGRYGLGVGQFRLGRCAEAVKSMAGLGDGAPFEYAPEVQLMLGHCALAEKGFEAAARAFGQVVERFPEHALADDALAGVVEAQYGGGAFDDALSSAKRFGERHSESPLRDRVAYFAASSEMARKEFAPAAEAFAALATRARDTALADRATYYAADCFERAGDPPRAIKQYGKVLERKDSAFAADALLALAQIAERQERLEESGKLVDRLLEKFPKSPLVSAARLLRGRVYLAQGKLEQAAVLLDAMSGASTSDAELRCEAGYYAAKVQLRKESFSEAAAGFRRIVEECSGSALVVEARYDLGVSLWKADRLDEAFAAFRGLTEATPNHELAVSALHAQSQIEYRRKRYDAAARLARELLERNVQHALASSAAFLSAECDFLEGRTAEAVEAFRAFLARYPEDSRAAEARSRLGAALFRAGDLNAAEAFLRESIAESPGPEKGGTASAGALPGTPSNRTALVALGDLYFQRGEWKRAEEALAEYVRAGDGVPAAEDAWLRLGLAQARQGRNEDAVRSFDQLLSRFPEGAHRAQVRFEKGQALVALGRSAEAETVLRTVLESDAGAELRAGALRHLAALAMQRQGYAEAAELFQRLADASESAADKRNARYRQGVALMAAREFGGARAVFAPLTRDSDDRQIQAASLAQLGSALVRENRCADAVDAFGEIAGGWSAVDDSSLRAAAQYDQAWCLRELGRADEASRAFRRLADADGADDWSAYALLELANLEAAAKRWDESAELLTKLLALGSLREGASAEVPVDVVEHAQYRLGICEFERGRYDDSSKALESFLARFPNSSLSASATFFSGESAFRAQRWDDAVRHLSRLCTQFPSDRAVDSAYLRLGDALASLQRWTESERTYAEYLERFADREQWFAAQFGLGWALENQRKYDDAVVAYEKVIARHQGPTAARAQFQIGECRLSQRRLEDAVREFLKVDILYAYPEWTAAAVFEAGRCLEELNKAEEAGGQFRRVVEGHAGTWWAELASKRLSALTGAASGH